MSTRTRQAKEIERRKKVRAAMNEGEFADDDTSSSNLDTADPTTINLVNAEIEVMGEEPSIADEPDSDLDSISASNEPAGLSADEITKLRGSDSKKSPEGLEGLEIHELNGYRFVQVKDLLPPTPPRGSFDVQKIRDSLYFFS
jgi:DNA-directed RNA polymerase